MLSRFGSNLIYWEVLVVFIVKLLEEFAVRVRQELISVKSETDGVVFDPFLFLNLIHLLLPYEIPELVIRNNEGISSLSILDAVGIIVILRRSLDYVAFQ